MIYQIEYQTKEPLINRFARGIGKSLQAFYFASLGKVADPYIDIPDNHHGFVIEFGRFQKIIGPGTYKKNVLTEKIRLRADVKIDQFQCGVLTKMGIFVKKLGPGLYFPIEEIGEDIEVYDQIQIPDYSHGVRLQDKKFVELLNPGRYNVYPFLNERIEVITDIIVKEHQMGVLLKNNSFVKTLTPGVYFANIYLGEQILIYDDIIIEEGFQGVWIKEGKFVKVVPPGKYSVNSFIQEELKNVPEQIIDLHHVGLKFINGQYLETLNPGRHFANPILKEKIIDVDMRVLTKELVPQQIYTKDTTSLTIHSILVYQIIDPVKACIVEDIDHSIREQIKSISQQVMSEQDLDYIMANKKQLSLSVLDRVKSICLDWGISVKAIDIKELELDQTIKNEMTAAAKAKRSAESKLIEARAEVEIAESQKKVADMLNNACSSEMRQLETLKHLAENPNTRFVFIARSASDILGPRLDQIVKENI